MSTDEYLNVDADGKGGTGAALAHVLRSVAETLEGAPDGYRYDFELTVDEQIPTEKEAQE